MHALDIEHHRLEGLVPLAAHLAGNHRGPRHRELVALAAHCLDQYGQVELPAAGDLEAFGIDGFRHPKRHVVGRFAKQPGPELPAGQEPAVAPSERRRVDAERHRQGRLVDGERRQRFHRVDVADGIGYAYPVDTGNADDVARARLGQLDAFEAAAREHRHDAPLAHFTRRVHDGYRGAGEKRSAPDPADADDAHVG